MPHQKKKYIQIPKKKKKKYTNVYLQNGNTSHKIKWINTKCLEYNFGVFPHFISIRIQKKREKIIKSKRRRKYVIFGFVFHQPEFCQKSNQKRILLVVVYIWCGDGATWAYITNTNIMLSTWGNAFIYFLRFTWIIAYFEWLYEYFFLLEIFLYSSFYF